jgi:hypothetical protein
MFNNRTHRASPLDELLAGKVARLSVSAVVGQLDSSAADMSPAELRGYLRAHTLPHVQSEARQLVGSHFPQEAFHNLVAAALELATHTLAEQLKSTLTVSMPAPHVRLRSAA